MTREPEEGFVPTADMLSGMLADMPMRGANVFTIPPGRPFLETLARAVLSGNLPRHGGTPPAELSRITILLPTRRAARALQEAFLVATSGRALLLPRIKPIAEGNEDLALLAGLSGPDAYSPGGADIPPAVPEITRRIVMTGLVQRWSDAMRRSAIDADDTSPQSLMASAGAGTAAQAAALALELARLLDEVETEETDLSQLASLVPDRYSAHWEKTLDFLKIVLEWWPLELAERKQLSPMERRNRLVRAEAARLATNPPDGPVIVAGVTGSIPATSELMRVVASLPQGAIVIPGLDMSLDDASWNAIAPDVSKAPSSFFLGPPERLQLGHSSPPLSREGVGGNPDTEVERGQVSLRSDAMAQHAHPEHPQYGLKRLIAALGLARRDVALLNDATPPPIIAARNRLISEAMRPARTTGRWHDFTRDADRDAIRHALDGVSLLEAPTAEDEAEAISLMLREVAETPNKTAALVTRDRLLARRVAIRLEAWGIRVDDSAGRPLSKTIPGSFLDLVIEAASTDFAPAAVVALLKHPLTRLGRSAGIVRRTARALEIAAFRTLYLGRGLDGLASALENAESAVRARERRGHAIQRLRDDDWEAVHALASDLRSAFEPLTAALATTERRQLREMVAAHVATAEALAHMPEGDRAPGLWAEVAGETASLFLAGLVDEALPDFALLPREYADLYRALIARETVRPKIPLHPRLSILGPLEARLIEPDLVIIGSLNDGTWPEQVEPGPWLNRPMRQTLGLPAPEERIGYAAHDFTMLLGAREVMMTRALKVDGVPAVASRWLLRLNALLEAMELRDTLHPGAPWLGWARWRSHAARWKPVRAPAPTPPLALRPRKLSVSGVETWMANPYAIFARDILRLEPMPRLDEEPDAALRGSIVHGALARMSKTYPSALPKDVAATLMAFAREDLEKFTGNPRVAAFWLLRLERFADWFAASEPGRRAHVVQALAEVEGKTILSGPAGPFTLTARADRIDIRENGLVITDYKTGASLSKLRKDAEEGFAPQLALEAAIALADGFAGVSGKRIAALRYISASGGDPAGAEIDLRAEDLAALANETRQGLERLIHAFDDEKTPYRAVRRVRFSYDYDDYAHLARTLEWSGGSEEDEE